MGASVFSSMLAISLGAILGANMRWVLGLMLNHLLPAMPLGTLAANLIGAYLVGAAVAVFAVMTHLPTEWRLFVITGFLGGLTTFSSFSAEVVALLNQARWAWAITVAGTHLMGSLAMTILGMASVHYLLQTK